MKKFIFSFIFLFTISGFSQTTSHWGATLLNSLGQPLTGLINVTLYYSGGALAYNLTEQTDGGVGTGYYYHDNVAIGLYDLKVGSTTKKAAFWIGANLLTLMANNLNASGQLGTSGIQDDAITSAKINTGAVTSTEILDGTVALGDLDASLQSTITTAGYQPDNVTVELNGSSQLKVKDASITSTYLADNAVTSAKIVDGTIAASDIASNAITSAKIAPENITTSHIADATITGAKIANRTVGSNNLDPLTDDYGYTYFADGFGTVDWGQLPTESISNSAITSVKILDGTITSADIGTGEVSTTNIADYAVTGIKIFDGVVTSTKITDGTIAYVDLSQAVKDSIAAGGGSLGTGSVTTTHIANQTILAEDMANDIITSNETHPTLFLSTSQFERIDSETPWQIKDGGIGMSSLSAATLDSIRRGYTVVSSEIVDGTIQAADIAEGAITTTEIFDGTIVNDDIADKAVNADKLTIVNANYLFKGTGISGGVVEGLVNTANIADANVTWAKLAQAVKDSINTAKVDLINTDAIKLPSSDIVGGDTVGTIFMNNETFFHTYSPFEGSENLFIGSGSGNFTNSGEYNIGIGWNALQFLSSGNKNVVISSYGPEITTGAENVIVGYGNSITGSQSRNVVIGNEADGSGDNNVVIGSSAFEDVNGDRNTAIGAYVGGKGGYTREVVVIGYNQSAPSDSSVNVGGVFYSRPAGSGTTKKVGFMTNNPNERAEFYFGTNQDVRMGVGSDNSTFLTLRSPNGTLWYITVDNNGVICTSTTRP